MHGLILGAVCLYTYSACIWAWEELRQKRFVDLLASEASKPSRTVRTIFLCIRASVDALCRDGAVQISRERVQRGRLTRQGTRS